METRIKLKDGEIFKKQTETMSKIIKEMQDSFKEIYTVGEMMKLSENHHQQKNQILINIIIAEIETAAARYIFGNISAGIA